VCGSGCSVLRRHVDARDQAPPGGEAQGLPLDRTVVLDRSRIDRFLSHDCRNLTKQGRSSHRSRLDVVAGALLFGLNESAWTRATLSGYDAVAPYSDD
jgi:hypothetical protein